MINSLHTTTIGPILAQRAHRFDAVHAIAEWVLTSLLKARHFGLTTEENLTVHTHAFSKER